MSSISDSWQQTESEIPLSFAQYGRAYCQRLSWLFLHSNWIVECSILIGHYSWWAKSVYFGPFHVKKCCPGLHKTPDYFRPRLFPLLLESATIFLSNSLESLRHGTPESFIDWRLGQITTYLRPSITVNGRVCKTNESQRSDVLDGVM